VVRIRYRQGFRPDQLSRVGDSNTLGFYATVAEGGRSGTTFPPASQHLGSSYRISPDGDWSLIAGYGWRRQITFNTASEANWLGFPAVMTDADGAHFGGCSLVD
jgi:hypothetical protein